MTRLNNRDLDAWLSNDPHPGDPMKRRIVEFDDMMTPIYIVLRGVEKSGYLHSISCLLCRTYTELKDTRYIDQQIAKAIKNWLESAGVPC